MKERLRKFGLALVFYVLMVLRMALVTVLIVEFGLSILIDVIGGLLIEYVLRPIDWAMRRIYPDTPKRVLEDECLSGPKIRFNFGINYEGLVAKEAQQTSLSKPEDDQLLGLHQSNVELSV